MTKIFNIIYTTNNILVVDKEAEIEENDWCFLIENHYINGGIGKYNDKKAIDFGLSKNFFYKIIASAVKIHSDIPLIKLEEDIPQLSFEYCKKVGLNNVSYAAFIMEAFKEGYRAAQSKLYTEENLRKVIGNAVYTIDPLLLGTNEFTKEENRVIQSLQPKYKQVELEIEEIYFHGSDYYKADELSETNKEKYSIMKTLILKVENDFVIVKQLT